METFIKTKICQNEVAIWHDRMISSDFLCSTGCIMYMNHTIYGALLNSILSIQCCKSVMQMIADIGPFICSYYNRHYDNLVYLCIHTSQLKRNYYGMIFTYRTQMFILC